MSHFTARIRAGSASDRAPIARQAASAGAKRTQTRNESSVFSFQFSEDSRPIRQCLGGPTHTGAKRTQRDASRSVSGGSVLSYQTSARDAAHASKGQPASKIPDTPKTERSHRNPRPQPHPRRQAFVPQSRSLPASGGHLSSSKQTQKQAGRDKLRHPQSPPSQPTPFVPSCLRASVPLFIPHYPPPSPPRPIRGPPLHHPRPAARTNLHRLAGPGRQAPEPGASGPLADRGAFRGDGIRGRNAGPSYRTERRRKPERLPRRGGLRRRLLSTRRGRHGTAGRSAPRRPHRPGRRRLLGYRAGPAMPLGRGGAGHPAAPGRGALAPPAAGRRTIRRNGPGVKPLQKIDRPPQLRGRPTPDRTGADNASAERNAALSGHGFESTGRDARRTGHLGYNG